MKRMLPTNEKYGFSTASYHRRNRLLTLLALPAVCLIWLIGWSLYWIGSQREGWKPSKIPDKPTTTLAVHVPEQELAIC